MRRASIIASAGFAGLCAVAFIAMLPSPSTTEPDGAAAPREATKADASNPSGQGRGPNDPTSSEAAGRRSGGAPRPDGSDAPGGAAARGAAGGDATEGTQGSAQEGTATRSSRGAPGVGEPGANAGSGEDGASSDVPAGFRDQASSDRADWLEDRMRDFLGTVEPSLRDNGLSRSCSQSGRTCTFEGPLTDDFVKQWFDAVAYGDLKNEEVFQGAHFSELSFDQGDDGKVFTITVKHPTSR